jgi:hypothetical protein
LWPVTILLSAAGIGVLAFAGLESPIRAVIALWFLFVCPGMAFVRLLRIEDALTELTLAVALSLALDGLVAGTMLYAGMWSPQWGLALLICMSAAGAALQIFTGRSTCVSGVPRDRSARECHDDRYRTVVGHPALVPHNGAAPTLAPVAVPPDPVVPQVGKPTVALALPTTSAEPANHQQPGQRACLGATGKCHDRNRGIDRSANLFADTPSVDVPQGSAPTSHGRDPLGNCCAGGDVL